MIINNKANSSTRKTIDVNRQMTGYLATYECLGSIIINDGKIDRTLRTV